MPLLPSPAIPSDPSPQVKVALSFAKGLGMSDIDDIGLNITDDYVHNFHPESLGVPSLVGKEAFIGFFRPILPQFAFYNILIKETIEAPGKVIFHADVEGKTKAGLEYKNEYIVILYVKEQPDGSFKVFAMKEFSDSKSTSALMAAMLGGAPPA